MPDEVVPPLPPTAPPSVAPIGVILEPPPPPESVGAPEFHTPTPDELAVFAPEPPIEPPLLVPPPPPSPPLPAKIANNGRGMSSDGGDGTAGDFETGGRPAPVASIEPPVFADPTFDQLPSRVQAELRAGHEALKNRAQNYRYVPPPADVSVPPQLVETTPKDGAIDWDKLSPKVRKELEAGKRRLAEKQSDYRVVQERVRAQAARDLNDGKIGSLDYPRG